MDKKPFREQYLASERLQKSITPDRPRESRRKPSLHIESAQAFLGGSERTGRCVEGASPSNRGSRTDSRKQQIEKLIEWARRKGILLAKFPRRFDITRRLKDDKGGQEHAAIYDSDSGRWVKVTRGSTGFGKFPKASHAGGWELRAATPLEYLDRLELSNKIFGDDIQLHAVVQDRHGNTNIITAQPDYKGSKIDSDLISEAMETQSFHRLGENSYYKEEGNILVMDLHDGNAVRGSDGRMHVFDAIMLHPDANLLKNIKDGTTQASLSQLVEDGKKSPAQRIREVYPLIKEITSEFSDHADFNQEEAVLIARKSVARASLDFDASQGIPFVAAATLSAKKALQEKYPGES